MCSDPGHILTSDIVHEMGAERGFCFGPGRDVELKGFGAVRVFELVEAAPAKGAEVIEPGRGQ